MTTAAPLEVRSLSKRFAIGNAFDLSAKPDSAITYYETFLALKVPESPAGQLYGVATHKRLGELYEAKGDRAKAESHYVRFIELWKDADPELQPRVHEVRERLVRLRRQQG